MGNVLGSTGDIYQMLQTNASRDKQVRINSSSLNLLNTISPTQEGNSKKERVDSVLNQGLKDTSENGVDNAENNRALDTGSNTAVTDSGTSANPSFQQLLDNTLNIQRLWLGDDYEWDQNEAEDLKTILRLSDDPQKTASRYIASKGYATITGLDVKDVFNNLDEISQYYIGDVYDAHDIGFFQKIKNGFIRNDLMSLEYEYMQADIAGNTERVTALESQIEAKKKELGDATSAIPTSVLDKIETSVLENFAYMAQPSLKGSLVSSVVTALGVATAAAFPIAAPAILAGTASIATAGTVAMAGKTMYEWSAGDKYYSLMHDEEYKGYKNKGYAYLLSTIEGIGTATIETVMDGATSKILGAVTGKQLGKIGINSLVDFTRRGITNRVADATIDWATGALDEGFMNEAPEYILGEITSILYKNSGGVVDEKTLSDRYDELKESIVQGIIVGGVYGALTIPSSLKSHKQMALDLRRTANASETMAEFENATKSMQPEGLSDEDFDTARTQIWKASQEQKEARETERREFLQKEFAGTVLESEEVASEELFSTVNAESGEETSVIPDGSVYRTDDNALYSEVTTDNKNGTQTVWYGNPEDHSLYGIVTVKSDGDTQIVESVRVRNGYENIRSEMIRDAVSNTLTTETNVKWNPTTKGLQSVKDELVNNNPNGTGLIYSSITRGKDSDIQSLKTQIKSVSPNLSEAEATITARLVSISDTGTNTIKIEKATESNTGRSTDTFRGATNLTKGIIYASQNSDVSTFTHELFHAVSVIRTKEAENLSNEIRIALQGEEARSQLESFIKNNLAVWGEDADINKIISSISEIKENSNANGWSVGQNENLARLYEAYRRSERSIQQSLPQAIRNLLQKLTQFMNKVYGTLKDTVPLNENIAKAYDSLMGLDDLTNETKRVESQGAFKEFQGISEKTEDIILFRSTMPDDFSEQIDNIVEEDIGKSRNKTITFATETPQVFRSLGLKNLPVEMFKDKIARAFFLDSSERHGHNDSMNNEVLKKVRENLADPIAVFKSATVKDSLVALYDVVDLKNHMVMISIEPSKKLNFHEINMITSVYGRNSESIYKKWISDGLLLYYNNEKTRKITVRLQLPSDSSLSNTNVLTKSQLVNKNLSTSNQSILYQDKLLDDIDNISNIYEAEAVARDETWSEYTRDISEAEKETADKLFDIASSLADDWERLYEDSEIEDRLEKERQLEEALPREIVNPAEYERLEKEEREEGLVKGAKNLDITFSDFVAGNAPDLFYEGNDIHKDSLFKNVIKDESVLREYLAILGEAYLYDTRATNRYYEQVWDKQWNRWEQVPITASYLDNTYRQTLRDRLSGQLANRGLGGAMEASLSNKPMSDAVIKKAQKELSDNARFYRNILALLMKRDDMLPDSLVTEVKGLDIPSRENLDMMSVAEFADLAKKVNNERLRQKILSGTAKFGSDEDQAKYKELVSYTKELDKEIKEKTKEIASLEKRSEEYESRVQELEELNKERAEILLDAEEIFNLLSDTFAPEAEKKEYRQELAGKYAELRHKYNSISPSREQEHIESAIQRTRSTKIKDGSHYRDAKKGGHAGHKQIYYGTKYGTEAWVQEVEINYPEIKERIEAEYNKNKRRNYESVAKEVIGTIRGEVKAEMNDVRLKLIANSAKTLIMNSNKIYSTLSAIKSIADGSGVVIPTVDLEAMKATEKELSALQKQISKKDTQIQKLKESKKQAVYDARTAERWKAAKEKQAIYEKQAQKINDQKYIVKRKIQDLKESYEQEIRNIKEEQRQKEKEKRIYQAIKDEKQRIASYIMSPVSLKSVDYSKAKEIQAIQSLIDPEFRREWVYDIKLDPEQNKGYSTMTVQQAKDYLNSLSDTAKIDLFSYMPQDLIERLTEQRKPLNDWTITELQSMATAVEGLKNEGKAILQAKKEARNAQARAIKRAILTAVGNFSEKDSSLPSSLKRMEEGKGFKARLHSIMFRTRRMQELAQLLDGGYGNKGAAYRLLVEEKRWHQDNEARAIEKRYKSVEGFAVPKNIDNMIERVEVDLGRGVKQEFTVDQLAYAWLSQYDEENKAAVMYGSLMTEGEKGTVEIRGKDIEYITGKEEVTREWLIKRSELIEDDEVFMQVAHERYDALIKTAEKEIAERNLWDLVNAINRDFNNPDNTKRLDAASIEYFNMPLSNKENYLPIKRMAMTGENLDNATADSMFNLNANRVTRDPAKGFLIERIEIAPRHQKQVDMSLLGVWQNSVKEQEHLIEFAGYIKKLRSVFESQKSSEVEREVNRRWSPALMREVKDYIELVANPDSSTKKDPTNEFFKTVRGRTGAAYLGWKASGIILQAITSPASAFSELKPWEVFAAYGQIGAHPIETINAINEKSQMMKNRTMNQIVDEAVQRRNQWTQSKASRRLNKFEEVGQIGLTLIDRYAVAGPWLAMYERTLRESEKLGLDTATSETRAVQRADEFILRTQPVGDPTELASFFRTKNEATKTILQFQTSLNVVWNNLTANTAGFMRQKKYASVIGNIVGYATAGVLLGLVQSGYDDDDDAKDKTLKTVYWGLTQGIDSIPVAGSALDSLSKYLITGDYDWYMNKGVSISPLYDKAIQALIAASSGDGWRALYRSAEAIGIGAGLPVSGAKELYEAVKRKSIGPIVGRE